MAPFQEWYHGCEAGLKWLILRLSTPRRRVDFIKIDVDKSWAEMGLHGPADDGHAASAEKMWDKMNGAHLTPAAEAELAHIRHVAPLMSYPHSVFHEEKAGGLFSLRPAFTGDVVDK